MLRLIFLSVILLELILLFGEYKILVKEEHIEVKKGVTRIVKGYGNLGVGSQDSLVCNYFNGRKVLEEVYWYSPNNIFGISTCTFFKK